MYRCLTRYGLSLMAGIMVVSCSSSPDLVTLAEEERVPVTFQLAQPDIIVTRATYDDGSVWTTGVNVSVKCTGGTEELNTVKTYVTADNGASGIMLQGSDATNTFYWLKKDVSKSFKLWYPASADLPTSKAVDADQNTVLEPVFADYDLLYAEVNSVTATDMPYPTTSFYHQLARLTVNVTMTQGVGGIAADEVVTGVNFGTANVAVSGDVTMATSNYNASTSSGGAQWTLGSASATITMRTVTDGTEYTCILPPQTIGDANTVLLTITTNHDTYTYSGAFTLYAGFHHTINATVSRMGVIITASVNDWGSGGNIGSGSGTLEF